MMKTRNQGNLRRTVLVGTILALVYWEVDSIIHAFLFHHGTLFSQMFATDIFDLWDRVVVMVALFLITAYWQYSTNKSRTAEKELKASEDQYRSLFENAYDMVQSAAPDGRLLFVNKAWLENLGYSQAETLTLNSFDIIHPDSLQHYKEIHTEVLTGHSAENVRVTLIAKDGKLVQVSGNISPYLKEGRVISIQGIFRDVTELERAEELFKILANNAPVGIYIAQDGKFCFVNYHAYNSISLSGWD